MCYGIRTDFKANLFEGSSELLAIADTLSMYQSVENVLMFNHKNSDKFFISQVWSSIFFPKSSVVFIFMI